MLLPLGCMLLSFCCHDMLKLFRGVQQLLNVAGFVAAGAFCVTRSLI